jgi:hypothetical protein
VTRIDGVELVDGPLYAWPAPAGSQNGIYVMTNRNNPQSQSQPGGTNDNPNEDRDNGTQSTIQPGGDGQPTPGGQPADGQSQPSDGGNDAANQGGTSGESGGNSGVAGPGGNR